MRRQTWRAATHARERAGHRPHNAVVLCMIGTCIARQIRATLQRAGYDLEWTQLVVLTPPAARKGHGAAGVRTTLSRKGAVCATHGHLAVVLKHGVEAADDLAGQAQALLQAEVLGHAAGEGILGRLLLLYLAQGHRGLPAQQGRGLLSFGEIAHLLCNRVERKGASVAPGEQGLHQRHLDLCVLLLFHIFGGISREQRCVVGIEQQLGQTLRFAEIAVLAGHRRTFPNRILWQLSKT